MSTITLVTLFSNKKTHGAPGCQTFRHALKFRFVIALQTTLTDTWQ